MYLPKDPYMLLSVVNTRLRDQYPSLEALCEDLDADKEDILSRLSAAGYTYDAAGNRFVSIS